MSTAYFWLLIAIVLLLLLLLLLLHSFLHSRIVWSLLTLRFLLRSVVLLHFLILILQFIRITIILEYKIIIKWWTLLSICVIC